MQNLYGHTSRAYWEISSDCKYLVKLVQYDTVSLGLVVKFYIFAPELKIV